MKKYVIREELEGKYTIYKKTLWGWISVVGVLGNRLSFESTTEAEKYITKVMLFKGKFPIVKELSFK